jgi:hypothetical protein
MRTKTKKRPARRASRTEPIEVEDSSFLTDADWAAINALRRAVERGGQKAASRAAKKLALADPLRFATVLAAFFPDRVREAIRDVMADRGIAEDDLKEMIQKLKKPTRLQ